MTVDGQPMRVEMRRQGLSFTGWRWSAPERPLVMLLHGFPDCAENLVPWARRLHDHGFEVLVPTMRGYEPSSQGGGYSVQALAEDVVAWIDSSGRRRAFVVGHDWGAVTAYAAASLAPERILGIVTLAVPHLSDPLGALAKLPRQLINSAYMAFFQLRGVSEAAVRRDDFALLDALWRRWSPGWVAPEEVSEAVRRTFRQQAVVTSALRYYRALARLQDSDTRASWRLMRQPLMVPTLALTGADDGCMDSTLYDILMPPSDRGESVSVHRIDNAGHWLHLEQPEVVERRVLEWLESLCSAL